MLMNKIKIAVLINLIFLSFNVFSMEIKGNQQFGLSTLSSNSVKNKIPLSAEHTSECIEKPDETAKVITIMTQKDDTIKSQNNEIVGLKREIICLCSTVICSVLINLGLLCGVITLAVTK